MNPTVVLTEVPAPALPDEVLAAMVAYEAAVRVEEQVTQGVVKAHHLLRDLVRRLGIVEPISLVIGTHTVHIQPPTELGWGYQIGCYGIAQPKRKQPHSSASPADKDQKGGSS